MLLRGYRAHEIARLNKSERTVSQNRKPINSLFSSKETESDKSRSFHGIVRSCLDVYGYQLTGDQTIFSGDFSLAIFCSKFSDLEKVSSCI